MRAAVALALLTLALSACIDGALPGGSRFGDERRAQLEGLHGPSTDQVVVVVHAQHGREPRQTTIDAIVGQFGALSGKPVTVDVRSEDLGHGPDHAWTAEDRQPFNEAALAEPWPPGVALAHVYAASGCYAYNATRPCIGGVSGMVAWVFLDDDEDSVTYQGIDEPVLRDIALVGSYRVERYLYVHELGHLFGLMRDIPQAHDRLHAEDCLCHSTDPDSVMYRSARGPQVRAGDVETFVQDVQDDNFHLYTFSDRDVADAMAYRDGLG